MKRDTYYINVADGSISRSKNAEPWNFEIKANAHEIKQLREYFDRMHTANLGSYVRSHIPFTEYHHDSSNDSYDEEIRHVYQLISQCGSEETKQIIDEMGILKSLDRDHL